MPALADQKLEQARVVLQSGPAAQAVALYAPLAARTASAERAAEYAYALAAAGFSESALYQLDRALISEPLNADVRFYLAELLAAFGLDDAGAEQHAVAPGWLKKPAVLPALSVLLPPGGAEDRIAYVHLLMAQKRYAQSAVLFAGLAGQYPAEPRVHAGYALALDMLGAYGSAAAEVDKDIALSSTEEHKARAVVFRDELLKRPRLQYGRAAAQALKGRYLLYLGGSIDSPYEGDTTYNLNTRVGKFLSDRFDVSVNGGLAGGNSVSDYNGLTLGVSGRYNTPLPLGLPFNATAAMKLNRVPAVSDQVMFMLSPGISYFMPSGSLDLFCDWTVAGSYSGSVAFSAGYTIYFGGNKK